MAHSPTIGHNSSVSVSHEAPPPRGATEGRALTPSTQGIKSELSLSLSHEVPSLEKEKSWAQRRIKPEHAQALRSWRGGRKTGVLKNEWGSDEQEDTPDVRRERTQKGKDRVATPTPKV